MNGLLDEVVAAHGGERWQGVSAITARGRLGGLLPKRFPGDRLARFTVRIEVDEQRTVIHDFPRAGRRAVLDRGAVRIEAHDGERLEARSAPRGAFSGLSGVRRNVRWDSLDTAYLAGYAFWNYLSAPFLLARDDIAVAEEEPWSDRERTWRRLRATFPAHLHTHCRQQTFHVDSDGLIRRHDFVAEPVGRWASAALSCDGHQDFDGLLIATRRRVHPRGPGGRVLARPTLLALDFDEIEVER